MIFEELLTEASKQAFARERNHTIVYKNWGTEWLPFGQPKVRRPMSSVILDDGVAESIRDDVLQVRGGGGVKPSNATTNRPPTSQIPPRTYQPPTTDQPPTTTH